MTSLIVVIPIREVLHVVCVATSSSSPEFERSMQARQMLRLLRGLGLDCDDDHQALLRPIIPSAKNKVLIVRNENSPGSQGAQCRFVAFFPLAS
jgi:hypothetical protein